MRWQEASAISPDRAAYRREAANLFYIRLGNANKTLRCDQHGAAPVANEWDAYEDWKPLAIAKVSRIVSAEPTATLGGNDQGRRSSKRLPCALPVEIETSIGAFSIKSETVDISLHGCYVRLLYSIPVGTLVKLTITVGETAIFTNARVITNDPNVGNGFEFRDMSDEAQRTLAEYLERVASTDASTSGAPVILQ